MLLFPMSKVIFSLLLLLLEGLHHEEGSELKNSRTDFQNGSIVTNISKMNNII